MKTYTYKDYTINLEKICYMKKTIDFFTDKPIELKIVFSVDNFITFYLESEYERDELYNNIKRAMQEV